MRTIIIGSGLLILCLLVLFRLAEVNFVQGNVRLEVIVAVAAVVFFIAGLYFNHTQQKKLAASSSVRTDKPGQATRSTSTTEVNPEEIRKSGLTQRELEVLTEMAKGLSNQEIASSLFLSESTIKTHVSNILFKLDARRRTQAVSIAKQRKIVAS